MSIITSVEDKEFILSLRGSDHGARLGAILDTYKNWHDNLSVNIHRWAAGLRRNPTDLKARVDQLVKEVLVDPINREPLRDPILERSWTWERTVHQLYRSTMTYSPLDHVPFSDTPPPHDFAKAMLAFVKEVLPITEVREESALVIPEDSEVVEVQSNEMYSVARLAMLEAYVHELEALLIEYRESLAALMKEKAELREIAIREAEGAVAECSAQMSRRIGALQTFYSEGVQSLEERLRVREENHKVTMASLEEQLSTIETARSAEAASFKKTMQECQSMHDTIQRELQSQLRMQMAAKAEIERKIDALEMKHTEAAAIHAKQEGKIHDLEDRLVSAHQTIGRLQDKIDDLTCVIM